MADPYIALKNVAVADGWIEGDIVLQSDAANINNSWNFKTLDNEPIEFAVGPAKFVGKIFMKDAGTVCISGAIKFGIISIPVDYCKNI